LLELKEEWYSYFQTNPLTAQLVVRLPH